MDSEGEASVVARLEAELAIERAKREVAEQLAEERAHRIEDLSLSLRMLVRDQEPEDAVSVTDQSEAKRRWMRPMFTSTVSAALFAFLPIIADTLPFFLVLIYIVGDLMVLVSSHWQLASLHSTR